MSVAVQSYKAAAKQYRQAAAAFPAKKNEYIALAEECEQKAENGVRPVTNKSNGTSVTSGGQPARGGAANTQKAVESKAKAEEQEVEQLSVEEALARLNGLIGLSGVKAKVSSWVDQVKFFKLRQEKGLPVPDGFSYHMVFTGNPGTGKTTVARLMAQIYRSLGILQKGQLVETARNDLVAGYVGQTAPKTREVIDKALGGVLFIDEAYMLKGNSSGNDFGQEAIDTVLKAMEDHRNELVVIMAGYSQPMADLIATNSGLKSRFNTVIDFEDYTPDELYKIFFGLCKKNNYKLTAAAEKLMTDRFTELYEKRDKDFGNGRTARNTFQAVVTHQAQRLMDKGNITEEEMITIEECDIPLTKDMK
ncbi:MAG: AAA family ATPase [Clostridia bacterium]|nr:AAA family ATPase [Clostridia bacterium]